MENFKSVLAYQFLKLHFKLNEPLAEVLRPFGITVKNFNAMQLIDANPGISQNGMAEIMQRDKTLVAQLVDKLEEKGFAKREPVENDRRVYALSLTEEGQKIVHDCQHIAIESESTLLAPLQAEDEASLRRILNLLMSQL